MTELTKETESKKIEHILNELRSMRNTHEFKDGYRSLYNSACDRLDILHSKLINGL
jgi:hypothetical protein